MLRIAKILASLLLLSAGALAQVGYFPDAVLDDTRDGHQSRVQWYSKHLKALQEPSLWELAKERGRHSYRFLWLRSFHRPISVRLDILPDQTGLLVTRITNGKGGYGAGRLIKDQKNRLSKDETNWFLERVTELKFWDLPTIEEKEQNVVGLDGAQWIMEGIKNGKYHVVDRWSPKSGPMHIFGIIMMIDLARLKLLYREVY